METVERVETVYDYYTRQGIMTDPGMYLPLLHELPNDVAGLVRVVQGLMMHIFWAERYGVTLSEERKAEVQIRPVQRKLARLLEIDAHPLQEARPVDRRLVGNCRDFSIMLTSMLKAKGIPARARCGFGTYFLPGHYEDHWMTEYWQADAALASGGRWVQVDSQLDALQQEMLGIQFNSLDMPAGQFITGGLAWQICRRGEANPDDFGIFDMHGWDFVKNDLLLDLRALNKVELLPWDVCGLATVTHTACTLEQMDLLDRIAALTLAGNESFAELRAVYEQREELHAPEDWLRT